MLKWTVKKRFTDEELKIFSSGDGDRQRRKISHARRSFGDVLNNENHDRRKFKHRLSSRRSLGNFNSNDKENDGETVLQVINRQSSTPLNDSSNMIKSFKRKHHMMSSEKNFTSPSISPISLANLKEPSSAVIFRSNYAPTLPSYDIEYSPVLLKTPNPVIPKILNLSSSSNDDFLPPKRLKFDAPLLDMSYEFKPESISTSSPLSTPLTTRKFLPPLASPSSISLATEKSLNSSEVGDTTLQKMIDDILASARHGKKFKKCFPTERSATSTCDQNSNFVKPLSIICETMEQKSIEKLLSDSKIAKAAERTLIIADEAKVMNEREVKSPVQNEESPLCILRRQNAVRRKNNSNENKKSKNDNESARDTANQDSTIQKCLSFSSANYEDISEKLKTSTTSSISSGSSYISQVKFPKSLLMKGSIELSISYDEKSSKVSIHVIKCRNLMKINESGQVNAYVKCALTNLKSLASQASYQRTAVHKSSLNPIFDHKFEFELNLQEDEQKFFQIAVWHRNKNLRRSEFLGCLMISMSEALNQHIHGCFLLQPQSSLTHPKSLVQEQDETPPQVDHNTAMSQLADFKNNGNLEMFKYLELNTNESTAYLFEGRTPLTFTKIIARQENGSFGFEISWSKPPKINSICSEQAKSGIQRGDFIIFINDKNVVSMPKEEVIELIKMQKNSLRMEIFRPNEKENCHEVIDTLAAQSTPNFSKNKNNCSNSNKTDLSSTPKSYNSHNFKQPKICFQSSVGNGIFV